MSQCFRTISCKLPPFIGTKKQVSQLSRQLPKHMKCSTFLEEFLGPRNVLNSQTLRDVSNEIVLPYVAFKNKIVSSLDIPHRENLISLRENVSNDVRIAKYKQVQRHEFLDVKPIDLLIEENWRSKEKFSKITRKQRTDGNVNLFEKFLVSNKDHISEMTSSDVKNSGIVYMSGRTNLQTNRENDVSNFDRKPSQEQLTLVFETLKKELPLIFVRSLDYRIYRTDFVFENNIRGTTTTGIFPYMKQIAILRMLGHLRFAYIKLDILKITMHSEDNSIKIRWRIVGLPGYKILMMFWKLNVFKLREAVQHQEAWYDGFSTFYVGGDGKIVKHVADKMMPDEEKTPEKKKETNPVTAKLTLFSNVKNVAQLFPDVTTSLSNISRILSHTERKWTLFEKIAFKMK